MDLPPPPPAIHAPLPALQTQAATSIGVQGQTITMVNHYPHISTLAKENTGRWWHTKHHRGAKHKSQKSRSNKRKAARRK